MKTLCKKHGKEYMDEQAPKAVVIKRDEDNCERCEEIRNGVNLQLFLVYLSDGGSYSEDVSEQKVIVAADFEAARVEALKLMMAWDSYKGGVIREQGKHIREVDGRGSVISFWSYWADWENGEKAQEYVFDSVEAHNKFHRELNEKEIANFYVKDLEIANGYKVTSVNAEKLQDCKVGAE
ncbi:hypothetical protein FT641_19835 [Bacillus paranthracis]|uniref:hypothetical protein n=1 Tax=Bacillus paranthracis TaxID=2026186 RepID=UPI001879D9AA|nr:hypothetical protein [Bacillus paranthracis]MBE7114687.1 hypothetical protein [Bacillus paranthracis]MBE7154946.1 hypothetical protein [Bacillus paranthracis]